MTERQKSAPTGMIGDPKAAGKAILKVADTEDLPLRVFFGKMPTQMVPNLYAQRLKTWKDWEEVSIAANG